MFKNPEPTVLSRLADVVATPLEKGATFLLDNAVGDVITKAIGGIVGYLNDGAAWTVRVPAVMNDFRIHGHTAVAVLEDIHGLQLEDVDKVVGYLGAKYRTFAAAEGAAAGVAGGLGIAADIPLLVSIALRAVNEFGTYYGSTFRSNTSASSPSVSSELHHRRPSSPSTRRSRSWRS